MTEVRDPRGELLLKNAYSADGYITKQTLNDGRSFLYSYHRDGTNKLIRSLVTDPAVATHAGWPTGPEVD